MSRPSIEEMASQDDSHLAEFLQLNNAHGLETSLLTAEKWTMLIESAFTATCVAGPAAFLLAFDDGANYDNHNFRWFGEKFSHFVYVDRIVVSEHRRGRGLARYLYLDLFDRMRTAEHDRVVCEVNWSPPNPASDAFHEKMGFGEVGRGQLPGADKVVRYLSKRLD